MQNLPAAHRQISASTIGRYRAMATPYRDGTWNHDVSQNIQALLAAIPWVRPYRILDLGCGTGRATVANAPLLIFLILSTYVPAISTLLPNLLYGLQTGWRAECSARLKPIIRALTPLGPKTTAA
jgi:SAM-dependent methyltransferase